MTPHFGELTVGEDGAALFDERARRVADIRLAVLMSDEEFARRDFAVGKARRLALAQLFAASEDLAAVALRFLGRMEFDGDECTCEPGDPCPLCATKAALRKAGKIR